jgi:hypothetical protein
MNLATTGIWIFVAFLLLKEYRKLTTEKAVAV